MYLENFKALISNSSNIVFFGGAGVSTESNIPDFRSEDGIFRTVNKYGHSPEVILSHSFFMNHPDKFFDFYKNNMIFTNAKPNKAHLALSVLEKKGLLKAIITQNIDGLHQAAGSNNVFELHGSVHRNYCIGTTSINGICAKPILDIAVVLKSFETMDVEGMKRAGYSYCGAQNEENDRYLFVLRGEGQISLKHIHCYEPDNRDFYYVTRFRDFLNKYEDYAKEYNNLKMALAEQYPDDRYAYTEKKEGFIRMIYQKIDAKENKRAFV